MAPINLNRLQTEARNPSSNNIDQLSTLEVCQVINDEDNTVASAVAQCLPVIANAIDALTPRIRDGGRVIYVGAGTSGRLGILDASEIPPTYSAPSSQFIALIAGGDAAIRKAQEGAEDSWQGGVEEMKSLDLRQQDSLIGIAASGRTPYVMGCLSYAKQIGCLTIGVACCSPSTMNESGLVDFMIAPVTGPEVVTGSTRMKAGTATKLVLNMLSTAVMVKTGKAFGNMMVDLKPSNKKLMQRARNILRTLDGKASSESDENLDALLIRCDNSVKLALCVLKLDSSVEEARACLERAGGVLSIALSTQSTVKGHSSEDIGGNLVLCVDGGATKCAAVVMNKQGLTGEGIAGPCNVTGMSIGKVISTIRKATEKALESFQSSSCQSLSFQSVRFRAVWVGLAGYDRPQLRQAIDNSLATLFSLRLGDGLTISNDVDLQVARAANMSEQAVVLVAGTGSIATKYRMTESGPVRTGRVGGWGHLLGDQGSGFDLGRNAIQHTLAKLDTMRIAIEHSRTSTHGLGILGTRILEHFSEQSPDPFRTDLLSLIISPNSLGNDKFPDVRATIAQVARIVLDTHKVDNDARQIVFAGIEGLVTLLKQITGPDLGVKPTLLFGGGLLQNDVYRNALLQRLKECDMNFGNVISVHNPAHAGVVFLRQRDLQQSVEQSLKSRL